METYLVRVWLPDRPGALGQVASRIGAVRGDVVGIEILERGAGRAIDELVVTLPEPGLVNLLTAEVSQVDGVDVEDVHPLTSGSHDPGLASLRLAARLMDARHALELAEILCKEVAVEFACDWSALVEDGDPLALVVEHGETPSTAWLTAFVAGSRHLCGTHEAAPDDLAWAALDGRGLVLVAGRKGRPFRWREREQLSLLSRIADGLLARDPLLQELSARRHETRPVS